MTAQTKGHVCVIGAGIIGATTVYALSKDGWSVTVIDSGPAAGVRASYANGTQLSCSYVELLASPNALTKIPLWLLSRVSSIRW